MCICLMGLGAVYVLSMLQYVCVKPQQRLPPTHYRPACQGSMQNSGFYHENPQAAVLRPTSLASTYFLNRVFLIWTRQK